MKNGFLKKAAAAVIFMILAAVVFLRLFPGGSSDSRGEKIQEGRDYLRALEERPVSDVEDILQYQHEHDFAEMREERLTELENGEISCWSLFEDYLICGDSRCVAFYYDGFLPEENIIAVGGETIRILETKLPEIISRAPKRLFLCYGMNDFCSAVWNSVSEWTDEYRETITQLHAALPDTVIYVSCIIPAGEAAYEKGQFWSVIPDWNAGLQEMCGELDYCTYMDFTALAEEHADLYLDDGVHFNEEFYGYLGNDMIMYVFDNEFPRDESGAEEVPSSERGDA